MPADKSYPSPNGRYRLDIFSHEVRMSHWIDCPSLIDNSTGELLFHTGQLWDTKKVEWAENGNGLALELRHYPGNIDEIRVLLDIANNRAEIHTDGIGFISGGSLQSVCAELSNTTQFRTLFY